MKKIFLLAMVIVFLFSSLSIGATLSLKATWTPPTKNSDGTPLTDLASYNLYRTDAGRALIGNISSTAAQPYSFSVTVTGSGTLSFVMTAVDASGNESADSTAVTFPYDLVPPAAPGSLKITTK